jgi:hypothetical protein
VLNDDQFLVAFKLAVLIGDQLVGIGTSVPVQARGQRGLKLGEGFYLASAGSAAVDVFYHSFSSRAIHVGHQVAFLDLGRIDTVLAHGISSLYYI